MWSRISCQTRNCSPSSIPRFPVVPDLCRMNLFSVLAMVIVPTTAARCFSVTGRYRADSAFFALFACWTLSSMYFTMDIGNVTYFLATVFGFILAGFERFSIGFVLHAIPGNQTIHEHYHDRLRQRKLTQTYSHSDALHEIVRQAVPCPASWLSPRSSCPCTCPPQLHRAAVRCDDYLVGADSRRADSHARAVWTQVS